jgi:prepilin-type N-terminal cleavage/methylation domain-containing protein
MVTFRQLATVSYCKHSSNLPLVHGARMRSLNRQGFTVIEAVMVLTVIGIVAATAGPKVSAALQRRTTASAADQFVLIHSLTRSTALRYGRVAQLHVDVAGQRYWTDVDTSANGIGQRGTIGNIRYISDNGLRMASNRALICFDARGIASTNGSCEPGDAKVSFSSGLVADTVRTTVLGKVLR